MSNKPHKVMSKRREKLTLVIDPAAPKKFVGPTRPNILDKSFVYVPATSTKVEETWRRFGWQPVKPKVQP